MPVVDGLLTVDRLADDSQMAELQVDGLLLPQPAPPTSDQLALQPVVDFLSQVAGCQRSTMGSVEGLQMDGTVAA